MDVDSPLQPKDLFAIEAVLREALIVESILNRSWFAFFNLLDFANAREIDTCDRS